MGIATYLKLVDSLMVQVHDLDEQLALIQQINELKQRVNMPFREFVCTSQAGRGENDEQVGQESWVNVGCRRRKGHTQFTEVASPEVMVSNRFQVLPALEPEETGEAGGPLGTKEPPTPRRREVVVVGDSSIRGVDRYVCTHDRGSRTVSCLPGAQVGDLPNRVDRLLAPAGVDPVVVVHVGTNDIGKGRRAVLQDKFIDVADKLRSRTSTVVFSGILPVPRASQAKLSEIRGLNPWLKWWCRKEGFRFMGHWKTFWNRRDLFKPDGLHLNHRGTSVSTCQNNTISHSCC
uniref:SGNH hydrolase-type esterase domain-containing protein n=1 Tax=Paramormyrops kingsleyae TaxID=1676925 RepID=A0A3B3SL27_9TELE